MSNVYSASLLKFNLFLAIVRPKIHYQSKAEMDPLASLSVWAEVSKYIIENDMEKAGDDLV